MPAPDLPELVHRTREAVTRLLRIVRTGAPDPTADADLEELLQTVGRLANEVHGRLLERPARRVPPSTAIDQGVHVERFNIAGDRVSERPGRTPKLSAAWNNGGRRHD